MTQDYKTMKLKNELSDKMWSDEIFGQRHPLNAQEFYIQLFDPIFDLGFKHAKERSFENEKSNNKEDC